MKCLGWHGVEGYTPVGVGTVVCLIVAPSSMGLVESCVNLAGPPVKPKYSLVTDSVLVP